jgi:hypothetical protein
LALLALFVSNSKWANAQVQTESLRSALLAYQTVLKSQYAAGVTVTFLNRADGSPPWSATFAVGKPIEGKRSERSLDPREQQVPESARLPLPLDLAARPELALPVGKAIELIGSEKCGNAICQLISSSGVLSGKGKVRFETRLRWNPTTQAPIDASTSLRGIPFVDEYWYSASFEVEGSSIRLAESTERLKGSFMFTNFDVDRKQTYSHWRAR